MSLSRPATCTAVHGPHNYHAYICGDHNIVAEYKTRLERHGLIVLTREFIETDGELQLAIWRSLAVIFVVSETVKDEEIHNARAKVKYFGSKFAVVLDHIQSSAAKLDEFMWMSVEEFLAFMKGMRTPKNKWLYLNSHIASTPITVLII